MTRGTARRILRRRINEVTADNWTDSDLDEIINVAVHKVQIYIHGVDPDAFVYIDSTPIVAYQEFYPKPIGLWYELVIRILNQTSSRYERIERKDYDYAETLAVGGDTVYSHVGRHFALRPVPSTNITAGLQILYVPTLSMATDVEDIPIHLALHDTVVKQSQVLLLPETGEAYKDVRAELDRDLSEIPLYYRKSGGEPEQLNPVRMPKNY